MSYPIAPIALCKSIEKSDKTPDTIGIGVAELRRANAVPVNREILAAVAKHDPQTLSSKNLQKTQDGAVFPRVGRSGITIAEYVAAILREGEHHLAAVWP